MIPDTIRELATYVDWARARLLEAAATCSDEQLDRPFDMGEGSLRKTLTHLWGAEQVWLGRWKGTPSAMESGDDPAGLDVKDLAHRFASSAQERDAWLAEQHTLERPLRYKRPFWMEPGPELELPLDVSVLHLLSHFPHHGAQAVNMLRRTGATPPALDYIRMRGDGSAPALDAPTLRRWLAHGDWAWRRVHEAAAALSDEARRRTFDIGPGSIQRIMRHLCDAPSWWVDNLENGPTGPFPAIDESDTWEALASRYETAARRRDGLLALHFARPIRIEPRPGVERSFAVGVVLMQLCLHGIHHRAQALNMLRHSGADVPSLDVNVWYRAGAPIPHAQGA